MAKVKLRQSIYDILNNTDNKYPLFQNTLAKDGINLSPLYPIEVDRGEAGVSSLDLDELSTIYFRTENTRLVRTDNLNFVSKNLKARETYLEAVCAVSGNDNRIEEILSSFQNHTARAFQTYVDSLKAVKGQVPVPNQPQGLPPGSPPLRVANPDKVWVQDEEFNDERIVTNEVILAVVSFRLVTVDLNELGN